VREERERSVKVSSQGDERNKDTMLFPAVHQLLTEHLLWVQPNQQPSVGIKKKMSPDPRT
jgi:hypothetical protein